MNDINYIRAFRDYQMATYNTTNMTVRFKIDWTYINLMDAMESTHSVVTDVIGKVKEKEDNQSDIHLSTDVGMDLIERNLENNTHTITAVPDI